MFVVDRGSTWLAFVLVVSLAGASHTVGAFDVAASAAPAAVSTRAPVARVQDPPAIPRPLLKRGGGRPRRFVRTELFFGNTGPDGQVTEEQFLLFLDEEVSRRFPDGLTVFKGHGRFTGEDGLLVKEEPFVVILLYPHDHFKESDRKVEDIRRLYRSRFRQESVLRVDYQFSVRVSF